PLRAPGIQAVPARQAGWTPGDLSVHPAANHSGREGKGLPRRGVHVHPARDLPAPVRLQVAQRSDPGPSNQAGAAPPHLTLAGGLMSTFIQAQYDDLAAKDRDLYAHTKYDILIEYLRDQPTLKILNAGCGSGDLSLRLAALGHHVHGIDPEPAYINLALK